MLRVVQNSVQRLLHRARVPLVARQAAKLLVNVHEQSLLGRRRARDAQELHQRRACGCIDHECQCCDAPHVEEYAIAVQTRYLAPGSVPAHLHRKDQPNSTPQATPSHDCGVSGRDRRVVLTEVRQDWPRAEEQHATDQSGDDVDHDEVQVVLPGDLRHGLASECPGEEEDQRVAQVLEHVPNVVQRLLVNDHRPHLIRENQGGGHRAEHPADVEHALRDDEAPVCAKESQRTLCHTGAVLQPVCRILDPNVEDPAHDYAEAGCTECRLDEVDNDLAAVVLCAADHGVGHAPQHNGRAVVQQGLALDLHCQSWGGTKLLQQAHHGHGVRGRQDGAGDEAEEEGPVIG
mmetsp:Transcript_70735/g.207157  ORF Transcript_70735/g.207157 Transcript_70735/m.207157 type:complete len:347 (-) Transcript_70735:766-1806(-)